MLSKEVRDKMNEEELTELIEYYVEKDRRATHVMAVQNELIESLEHVRDVQRSLEDISKIYERHIENTTRYEAEMIGKYRIRFIDNAEEKQESEAENGKV